MKILILTQYFWPEYFRINELASALQKEGCEITVLTGQPNYPDGHVFKGYKAFSFKKEIHNGQKIFRVPIILRPKGKRKSIGLFANYISFILSAGIFGPRLLKNENFDAILVYAPSPILQAIPAVWLKRIKKAPLITWIGDLWPESLSSTGFVKNSFVLNRVRSLVKYIYRNCDLLLIQSNGFERSVKALAGNTPVEYYPNPGEDIFSDHKSKSSPLTLSAGFNVVFAGNLGSVQSLDTIFEAAVLLKDHKDINFVLIGSGSKSDWLKQEIQKEGLQNIMLPGRFGAEFMPAIFSQADAMLVSLIKDETMSLTAPSKIQSYMAASKPIIASIDGEGARLVTEAGAGIAAPANDAKALAQAILDLKNLSPAERVQMGHAGRTYYEQNFDAHVLACQLKEKIKKLGASVF